MKTGFGIGLLIGLLLAAPLVSILYLLHAIAGMPFIPFDLFDGLVRVLPGPIVTFGIDSMVRLLMFLGLDLSGSSKTMEQIQAIGIFLGAAAIASGIFFAVLKDKDSHATVRLGVMLGVAVALALTPLAGSAVWTVVALTAWGVAVSAVRDRIARLSPAAVISSTSPQAEVASSVTSVDRRHFLINLGGATASITVIGAVAAAALRTSSEPIVHATSDVVLPDRPGAVEPVPGTRPEYTPSC